MNEQVLTVIMKEYEMLRAESQDKQKTQFTMISLIVSAISIVFGLTADLESSAVKISLPILYCFLLPCTIMFFGILWLDQVYRQVMIGAYTVQIEDRINSLLRADMPSGMSNIIGWEQWLSAMRPTKGFWRRTNYYYAYQLRDAFCTPDSSFCYRMRSYKNTVMANLFSGASCGICSVPFVCGFICKSDPAV